MIEMIVAIVIMAAIVILVFWGVFWLFRKLFGSQTPPGPPPVPATAHRARNDVASEIAALRRMGSGTTSAAFTDSNTWEDLDDGYIWSHPVGSGEYGEIQFRYRNLRGQTGRRRVRVLEFTERGFSGYDLDKRQPRTFNYRGIIGDVTMLDTGELMNVEDWVGGLK